MDVKHLSPKALDNSATCILHPWVVFFMWGSAGLQERSLEVSMCYLLQDAQVTW